MKNIPLFIGLFAVMAMMVLQAGAKDPESSRSAACKKSPKYIFSQGVCQPSPTQPPDDGGQG